jgi:diguanylate cyclase (GGDEF)-like protein
MKNAAKRPKIAVGVYKKPLSRWIVVLGSFVLVIVIAVADYYDDPNISLFVLYLIPVFLTAWYVGRIWGFCMLAISIASMIIHDAAISSSLGQPFVPYWTIGLNLAIAFVFIDIADALKKALEREKIFSRIDYLTGAANSRYFFEVAAVEMSRAQRYRRPFTLAYIDLDNFKIVNDNFGHKEGDRFLVEVVKTIKQFIRAGDLIARVGGDEFVILLPETGYDAAELVMNRIRKKFVVVMQYNKWPATFSAGMVTCVSYEAGISEIMKIADNLMYEAKENGKNMINHQLIGSLMPPKPPPVGPPKI